jgi:hypothetical protein
LAFDSFDTALATRVLPHPGGPYKSTPAGADRPIDLNLFGLRIGSTIDMRNSSLTLTNAPTSCHVVLGTVEKPSLCADGFTNFAAF